jgi:CheY-like chemotaxis protein
VPFAIWGFREKERKLNSHHPLLQEQILRWFDTSPPVGEAWEGFLDSVSQTYHRFGEDIKVIERLLQIGMEELNRIKQHTQEDQTRQPEVARKAYDGGGEDLPAPSKGVRILLVEDDPGNQKVAQAMLEKAGFVVDSVDDGLSALDALAKRRFHLILMDLNLPRMDGISTTRVLREVLDIKDLPVIALTAVDSNRDKEACFAAGMNDFVSKPFTWETLEETVQKWLPLPAVKG